MPQFPYLPEYSPLASHKPSLLSTIYLFALLPVASRSYLLYTNMPVTCSRDSINKIKYSMSVVISLELLAPSSVWMIMTGP